MSSPLAEMSTMAHILMKFGGGLITSKSEMKTVDQESINNLANLTRELVGLGHRVTIVHGAGSFGHLKAKQWKIVEGAQPEFLNQQLDAVASIRNDMLELNSIICAALQSIGVNCNSFPPSNWARGVGPNFHGSLSSIENCSIESVPITFGDAVDCDEPKMFGILSGDDLMVRIGKEINGITHCIFLLGDTEGLLSAPPNDPTAELIEEWNSRRSISGEHDSQQDVTGGIFLKLDSAAKIATVVPNVWFICGRRCERVLELVNSGNTRGTRILP